MEILIMSPRLLYSLNYLSKSKETRDVCLKDVIGSISFTLLSVNKEVKVIVKV